MRRVAGIAILLVGAAIALGAGTASSGAKTPTYLVRAIFDNAGFAVPGEDVRISGAPVGSIQSLSVTKGYQAAVTIAITNPAFTPFHQNATCAIRPQSLIGERYVDCEAGSSNTPALTKITRGPGSGSYYLPVTRTSSPIDADIVQDIYQLPIRQRFALILNELGTGLAARGSDLNAVVMRADPALGDTDKVLQILAKQNHQLAQLSSDSNRVLSPLARVKRAIADFVVQANTTSEASASRAADISRSINQFPPFLRALRPLVVDLGQLADQGTPLMDSLGQSASAISRQFENLTPFAKAAKPALIALGKSSAESLPALQATMPLAQRLNKLGVQAEPASKSLDQLLESLNQTGAIEQLMSVLFYGTSAGNGFDANGHYVRVEPLVGGCASYQKVLAANCNAHFNQSAAADVASTTDVSTAKTSETQRIAEKAVASPDGGSSATLTGLLHYLVGSQR
jgi:phospholipid/cholesterol/gamma-HCH transport system substrate-binding protein